MLFGWSGKVGDYPRAALSPAALVFHVFSLLLTGRGYADLYVCWAEQPGAIHFLSSYIVEFSSFNLVIITFFYSD